MPRKPRKQPQRAVGSDEVKLSIVIPKALHAVMVDAQKIIRENCPTPYCLIEYAILEFLHERNQLPADLQRTILSRGVLSWDKKYERLTTKAHVEGLKMSTLDDLIIEMKRRAA